MGPFLAINGIRLIFMFFRNFMCTPRGLFKTPHLVGYPIDCWVSKWPYSVKIYMCQILHQISSNCLKCSKYARICPKYLQISPIGVLKMPKMLQKWRILMMCTCFSEFCDSLLIWSHFGYMSLFVLICLYLLMRLQLPMFKGVVRGYVFL